MMEEVEEIYPQIGQAIVDAIPGDWLTASVEATFFPNYLRLFGEYVLPSGESTSLDVGDDLGRAFAELRKRFKKTGQPVWGQAVFNLSADGKFKLLWGYDNCDVHGDTIFSEEMTQLRISQRIERLGKE